MSAREFLLTDEEQSLITACLERSLDNGEYALRQMRPDHERRAALVRELQLIHDLMRRLASED